jgi:hypothetical protein
MRTYDERRKRRGSSDVSEAVEDLRGLLERVRRGPEGVSSSRGGNDRTRSIVFIGALVAIATGCLFAGTAQAAGPAAAIGLSLSPSSIVANGTSTTTATVRVTDASAVGVAGEPVALSSTDSGEVIGKVADAGNGTYTTTITSSTTVGPVTIKAADGALSTTQTLTQTLGPPASVVVSLKPPSIVADGSTRTTATAAVADAQGHVLPAETVVFSSSDRAEKIGNTTNAGNGAYTATITSSTTVGTRTITATDGAVKGHAVLTQTVGAPASITVQVSPGAILADGVSTTTAVATVTDGQGHRVPTDTIAFSSSDPGQFFGPVSNNHDGTYTARVRSSNTVGQATITATDPSHVSGQTILTQAAGPSSMSVVATPSTLVTNQSVTLLAVVTASTGSPSGTITFLNGAIPIAGCVGVQITPSNPAAGCQTSFAAGTSPERLTAVFTPGRASTAPGSTGTTTVVVKPDSSWISLAAAGSVEVGHSTTYSANVGPAVDRPGPTLPSGSVAFFDNGQPVASCRSRPLVSGTASCALTYERVGNHTITARYSGDANFTGSASSAQTVSVVPAPARVLPIVRATMQWAFLVTPGYSRVLRLIVRDASAAESVIVTCHGRGCPFARHTASIPKAKRCGQKGKPKCPISGTVNLVPVFKSRHLRVGVTITVSIRRPSWIGKYYKFVIRGRGGPAIQISCLATGRIRPGVGCSL